MLRFAPYVLKSLWRHRTRTMLTVSGTSVALFVFCFIDSARGGLESLTSDQANRRTLIVFQANRFCPATSRLPEEYARAVADIPGVRDVVPMQVYLNNCRASLDLVVFHGLPAEQLRTARDLQLISGKWKSFIQQSDGALVGRALAARRRLAPGAKFTIGEVTVSVAGVFASASAAEENLLYTHLAFLQRMKDRQSAGTVTQLEVQLQDDANSDEVARRIDDRFRSAAVATETRPRGVFQAGVVSDLAELIGWSAYLGYACLGLVLALVATTTLMAVQDRIREYAVLQALGYSGWHIFAFVLTECLLLSAVGGALGVGTSLAFLAWARLAVGTEGVAIALVPSAALAVKSAVVILTTALAAGVAPACLAAFAPIVPSLREG
jgi:putative ABC transport system permease protein